ncbi:MAG: MaoC family dehydratase [Burkholderiaceae bacterium]
MPVVKTSQLSDMVGRDLGVSDWITVSQERIDAFANCTDDHQFIHIDPDKAKKTPFGGTIAHGFLTMSLLSNLAYDTALSLEGAGLGINYGFEKGRFLSPVHAGKRIRARFTLKAATEKKPKHWMLNYDVTVEIENEEKPAMQMEWVTMQVLEVSI